MEPPSISVPISWEQFEDLPRKLILIPATSLVILIAAAVLAQGIVERKYNRVHPPPACTVTLSDEGCDPWLEGEEL